MVCSHVEYTAFLVPPKTEGGRREVNLSPLGQGVLTRPTEGRRIFGQMLFALWLSLGSLRVPFSSLWFPFGYILASFWLHLPLGSILASFSPLIEYQEALIEYQEALIEHQGF